MIVCYRRICEAIEGSEPIREVSYSTVICVEDMRPVLMYVNTFDSFRVYVSGNMIPLINNDYFFPLSNASLAKPAPYRPAPTTK